MHLSRLDVLQVRNLASIQIDCHPRANVIYGSNGSGKTSLLEAIYILGSGRSFKHRDLRVVVNNQAQELVVSARIERPKTRTSHQLGIKRTAQGKFEARIDGKPLQSAVQLVEELPLQLIDAHSFTLLEGGPLQRRQFLDWGVFHVEHGYTNLWRRFQKALKQRNQLLRHGRIDEDLLAAWTTELLPLTEQVTEYRRQYLLELADVVKQVSLSFDGLGAVELEYYQGWAEGGELKEVFKGDALPPAANNPASGFANDTVHGVKTAIQELDEQHAQLIMGDPSSMSMAERTKRQEILNKRTALYAQLYPSG